MRRTMGNLFARHAQRPAAPGNQAHDRAQHRCLARAVASHESEDLAGGKSEGDVPHDLDLAIRARYLLKLEHASASNPKFAPGSGIPSCVRSKIRGISDPPH